MAKDAAEWGFGANQQSESLIADKNDKEVEEDDSDQNESAIRVSGQE